MSAPKRKLVQETVVVTEIPKVGRGPGPPAPCLRQRWLQRGLHQPHSSLQRATCHPWTPVYIKASCARSCAARLWCTLAPMAGRWHSATRVVAEPRPDSCAATAPSGSKAVAAWKLCRRPGQPPGLGCRLPGECKQPAPAASAAPCSNPPSPLQWLTIKATDDEKTKLRKKKLMKSYKNKLRFQVGGHGHGGSLIGGGPRSWGSRKQHGFMFRVRTPQGTAAPPLLQIKCLPLHS